MKVINVKIELFKLVLIMKRERGTCTCKNLLLLSLFVKVEKLHTSNAMYSLALLSIERLDEEMVNTTPIRLS